MADASTDADSEAKAKGDTNTDLKSPMPPKPSKPWLTWPAELPYASAPNSAIFPHFERLTSKKYLRQMLVQVRARIFEQAAIILAQRKIPMHNTIAVLAGGKASMFEFYDTDVDVTYFRQEQFFRYVFGLNEPDCLGIIDFGRKEVVGFVPQLEGCNRWNGDPFSLEHYRDTYGWQGAHYRSSLGDEIGRRAHDGCVLVLDGVNSDSGLRVKTRPDISAIMAGVKGGAPLVDDEALFEVLVQCRLIKTPIEIELLRAACYVSSQAHVFMMRHARPGMVERQLEGMYQGWTQVYGGSRALSYGCICCAGASGSILHYGHAGRPNDQVIRAGQMLLLDLGAEFMGYATDITTSFPIDGKFTADQRAIYEAVLDAQQQVEASMHPGVSWVAMHRLAERVILKHLLTLGVCRGGSVDELMEAKVCAVFMPHGLGHLLGMAVHDVGGFTHQCPRISKEDEGPCWLRTTRVLEEGMVLTVEPGIYFNLSWTHQQLKQHPHKAAFLDLELITKRFARFGGVRLEDDVVVTKTGIDNLTVVPRTIADIEELMSLSRGPAGTRCHICPPSTATNDGVAASTSASE